MEIMVWIGAVLTLAGLAGVVWSIVAILRARRGGLDDAALRARLGQVLPWNLGAFFLSVFGLLLVVTGIMLG